MLFVIFSEGFFELGSGKHREQKGDFIKKFIINFILNWFQNEFEKNIQTSSFSENVSRNMKFM